MEPTNIFAQYGVAGAVVIVVILFLNFLNKEGGRNRETQEAMRASIDAVCQNMATHDVHNGEAHRQAAQILDGVAKVQRQTFAEVRKHRNGNGRSNRNGKHRASEHGTK